MAIYRQVHTSFWQDNFVLDLTPEEKFFYIYLMTNSKASQSGVYELPKKVAELETGYNRETVEKLINRFEEYGKIKYCNETKEVFLLNWLKYNPVNNINIEKRILKEVGEIKNEKFKLEFISLCLSLFDCELIEGAYKGLIRGLQGATKPLPSNNKLNIKKNKDKLNIYDQQVDRAGSNKIDFDAEFDALWKIYPRKVGKAKALQHYKKYRKTKNSSFEDVKEGIEKFNKYIKLNNIDVKFIPHGSTWFNQKRWDDELDLSKSIRFNKNKKVNPLPDWYDDYQKELKKQTNKKPKTKGNEGDIKKVKEMLGG